MPTRHRSLLQVAGTEFMVTAFIARLPPAMVQMGLLMIVVGSGQSYAAGGATVAAVGLGSAVGAPWIGALYDRFGPRIILVISTTIEIAGLAVCLYSLANNRGTACVLASAALIGIANPQVGSVARARWTRMARASDHEGDNHLVQRAMGYEGAVDEIAFIIGPAGAGILVGLLGPVPSLVALMVFVVVGQGGFFVYALRHAHGWRRQTDPHATSLGNRLSASQWLGVIAPVLCGFAAGTSFGATQTALSAHFAALHMTAATGIVYGSIGIGSATSSLLVPRIAHIVPAWLRLLVGGGAMAASTLTLAQQNSVIPAIAACVMGGIGVGVVLVTGYGMLERVAPTHRLTSMMTWVATSVVLGVSCSSFVAGRLADRFGTHTAFMPAAIAGGVIAVTGIAHLRRR